MSLTILFLALLIIAVAVALFRRGNDAPASARVMRIAACLLLAVRPLVGDALFPAHELFFAFTLVLLAGAGFILNVLPRAQPPRVGRGDIYYLGFLTCVAASVHVSVNRSVSMEQLSVFIAFYGWFWLIRNQPEALRGRAVMIRALTVATGVILLFSLHQYLFGFQAMREFALQNPEYIIDLPGFWRRFHANAVFGPFRYPPALAGYLTMLLPVTAGLWAHAALSARDGFKRGNIIRIVSFAGLFIFGCVVLVLTRSKGGWVSTGFSLMLVMLFFPRRWRWNLGICGAGAVVATVITVTSQRMLSFPDIHNAIASLQVRGEYVRAATAMISQRPFLGFGSGTFGTMYPLFKTRLGEETTMAHNSFLQLWAESGIFSVLFFTMFWGALLHSSWGALRKKEGVHVLIPAGLFAGLAGFLLHNLVDFDLYQGQLAFTAFTLAGLLVEYTRHSDQAITWRQPFRRRFSAPFWAILCVFAALVGILGSALAAEYLDFRAGIAFGNGEFDVSQRLSARASRLNPGPARYFVHQGIAREANLTAGPAPADVAQIIAAYRQAVRREPFTAALHYRLGRFLLRSHTPAHQQQGIASLERAAACYPRNPFYQEALSAAYASAGRQNQAVAAKELAEELKKDYIRGTR